MDDPIKTDLQAQQEPLPYDPLCAGWFQTAGDLDDFIFYGETGYGSER